MSGTPPPQNGPVPSIRGDSDGLTPLKLALLGAGIVLIVGTYPLARHLFGHRHHDETPVQTPGRSGEAWHPPVIPAAFSQNPLPPPQQPETQQQPPPHRINPFRALAVGKQEDPEEAAINAPIHGASLQGAQFAQSNVGGGTPIMQNGGNHDESELSKMLKPTETSGYRATRLAHPMTTIEQGRVIACSTVTRATSQLPGFIQAKVARDVWSADGNMILIPQNSTMFGEISHGLVNGQDRLFVLWRQVTTPKPDFVRITLNSPAADELGETGIPGQVDRHFWQKIGSALILSGVEAGLQGLTLGLANSFSKSGTGSSNLSFYQLQGNGQSLASQLLANTVNIPDTITVDQSSPCSAFVSGDLDFGSEYAARVARSYNVPN